jgi:hypothetical protein
MRAEPARGRGIREAPSGIREDLFMHGPMTFFYLLFSLKKR